MNSSLPRRETDNYEMIGPLTGASGAAATHADRATPIRPRRLGASASSRTTAVDIPASAGVHGPGEMTTARGLRSASSFTSIASFRMTHVAAPSLRKYRAMLKTKEIVVIDDDDQDAPHSSATNARKAFLIFGGWIGHRRYPATCMKDGLAVVDRYSANRDIPIHMSVEPYVADRPAIHLCATRSTSRITSIDRTLGAPVMEPPGKQALSRLTASSSRASSPVTTDTRWCTEA